MKVCLFVYEFPHFKSEHGLKTLLSYGHDISLVIAQPFKKLSVPRSNFKISPKLPVSGDVKAMCESKNIPYVVFDHDSFESYEKIVKYKAQIGIILGARILKEATINMFNNGILNIHPGKIPENRGLDNFKWALINNIQMANTAHLIDKRIDMGALLKVSETKVFKDDTLYDFYLRHFFSEFSLMVESLTLLQQNDFKLVKQISNGSYFNAVPSNLDNKLINYFENYKLMYSVI